MSGVDDQQVTKRGEHEAANDEERSLPDFDEMIDMDTLYGLGHPYSFNAGTQEGVGEQTNTSHEL